jgi:hypothetical protein
MRFSKVFVFLAAILLSVLGIQTAARAMLTGTANGGSPVTSPDPAGFYLNDLKGFDQAAPGNVTTSSRLMTRLSTIEYSAESSVFHTADTPASINSGDTDISSFFSRRVLNNSWDLIDAEDVIFHNYDLANWPAGGGDPFRIFFAQWIAVEPAFIALGATEDMVKPSTPVPASALMLITGLVGLIGFRRRMMNR